MRTCCHPRLILSLLCLAIQAVTAAVWSTVGTDSFLARLDDVSFSHVRIGADGTIRLSQRLSSTSILTGEDDVVWQFAHDRAGSTVVGTGHRRRLYLTTGGKAELLYDGGDGEILAAARDPQGNIWFATSPDGQIFRLDSRRQPESLTSTGETYVFCLIPDPRGGLLCGTGTNGRLLRISSTGTTRTVLTLPQANITFLNWLVPGKELCVGTSPAGIVYRLSFRPGFDEPDVKVLFDTPLEEIRSISPSPQGLIFVAANPAEQGEESGNPAVFCVDSAGNQRWRWTCPDSCIFGTLWYNDELWVLTGNKGMVYALDTLGAASAIFRLAEPQVTCISLREGSDRILIGTGNPGHIYSVSNAYADSGYIISLPFDCSNPARFGQTSVKAETPLGAELTVELRSGNSATPDSTWSGWSRQPPNGRYVQWRATLRSNFPNTTPILHRVDVYYSATNRAPVINSVSIAAPAETEARRGETKPVREITWNASDPDSDSLVYDIHIRPEHGQQWQRVAEDLTEERFQLDTRMLPDGWYRMRIIASDRADRAATSSLSSQQTSLPFLVDNTPPQVSAVRLANGRISFLVTDALSAITACRVSVNLRDWMTVEPADGIFDSPSEQFSVPVELRRSGNVVAVWAADAFGNVTTARLVTGE